MRFMLLALTAFLPQVVLAAQVDPSLVRFAQGAEARSVRVVALMDIPTNVPTPRRYDSRGVFNYLVYQTQVSWKQINEQLKPQPNARQHVQVRAIHYVNNSFVADVTPDGLRMLANLRGVSKVYRNNPLDKALPITKRGVPARNRFTEQQLPYDLLAMGIDQLRQTQPQVNGTGVLVGHIDTGVDAAHPALQGRVVGFYDPARNELTAPFDTDDHGTHTAGTIVGGQNGGIDIGVAPGAKLLSSAALTGYDNMLKTMEFMLDPDRNPETKDQPRVISNSWNSRGAPDMELFYRAISAWEAAGILPVFSAGNSGPGAATITPPHEHPDAFAVAATGPNGQVANFSSRGPGRFRGQDTQKPDVSAPGVDIVSTMPGGRFAAMSGTSMAAPHVAGLAALLYQVNPSLTPPQVRQLILQTLTFVDVNGRPTATAQWNPAYGFGHVHAMRAVEAALRLGQDRRFGLTNFQPARLFMLDASSNFKPATSLTADTLRVSYPTDHSKWVDGRLL